MPAQAVWVKKALQLLLTQTLHFIIFPKHLFRNIKPELDSHILPGFKDLGLNDVYLLAASGYHKINDNEAISADLRYFSLGSIQFSDYNGNNWGEGRPREFAFDLGYSRKLSDKLGIGLTLRYINSNLTLGAAAASGSISAYKAGQPVAADVSLTYKNVTANQEGWTFGFVLSNLGYQNRIYKRCYSKGIYSCEYGSRRKLY